MSKETKYSTIAEEVLSAVGGAANVSSLMHCATRLRFVLVDEARADLDAIKAVRGVMGVTRSGGQTQVIIGTDVPEVYAAIQGLGVTGESSSGADEGGKKGLTKVFDIIAGVFTPIIFALAGAGMLKGLLILATTAGWLSTESGTYTILYAAADGFFYFLPLMLAATSAKKFNADRFVAMGIAAALVYPALVSAFDAGTELDFLGIPVVLTSYANSVIPIILAVAVQGQLERLLKRFIPSILNVLVPLITLTVMVPLTLIVIGPVATWISSILAQGYTGLVALNPTIAGFVLGAAWPLVVMFGLHYGFVPIVFNNLATHGRDTLFTITGPHNMAQSGAAFGVFLKTKNKELKQLAGSTSITGLVAGVTEPAIYGVNLKYKRPFFIGAAFSGIAGAITATVGAGSSALVGTALLTLPAYIGVGFVGFLVACAIAFLGSAIVTYLFGFSDSMLEMPATTTEDPSARSAGELAAPVSGRVVDLGDVADPAFAEGSLGRGVAIAPTADPVVSPVDGEVTMVYPTGHAFGVRTASGAEILVHIGFDTVQLKGDGFSVLAAKGDRVRVGTPIVDVDLDALLRQGIDMTTCMVVAGSTTGEPVDIGANAVAGQSIVFTSKATAGRE